MMETEYDQLVAELDRIGDEAKWNTQLVGTGTVFTIQVGADKGMDIAYFPRYGQYSHCYCTSLLPQLLIKFLPLRITTIDADIATVNTSRATAGAFLTRFEGALDNALEMAQNLTDTRSSDIGYRLRYGAC